MIDFGKLAQSASASKPSTIIDTFLALDRQVSHVELRPSQLRTLEALSARISERDVVVKLNTGGGKTTIGLLYLKHLMDKYREPAVFLVPNIQLAEQVISEGGNIGLPVFHWKAKVPFPPEEALRCEGVIVCTYDKFFNGKSTFARQKITPCGLVLDDVHAGIESIRQSFSARLPDSTLAQLVELLGRSLEEHDPITWAGVRKGSSDAIVEVPFWLHQRYKQAITNLLSAASESDELKFAWANIAQAIDVAKLYISGGEGYITVDPAHVERVAHFVGAKHRLFMSASVHDGAVLVRELGCEAAAAKNLIDASGETATGERMVVVPSLVDPSFDDRELVGIAQAISRVANVVVLVPSFAAAKRWAEAGAFVATHDLVSQAIALLRRTQAGNMVVFAQRYDGVDLPDNACRLLIIDGLPVAESLADRNEANRLGAIAGMRGKTAIKIEQGLGRAVRSSSDYCAVILGGRELANFISRSEVARNLSPYTVRQIEIGRDVSSALRGSPNVTQGIVETVAQLLRRDAGWKLFYQQEMSKTSTSDALKAEVERRIDVAAHERDAVRRALARDYVGAARHAQSAADLIQELDFRGLAKQSAARYQHLYDEAAAMRLQVSAYTDNPHVSRPPMLLPAQVRRLTDQATAIASWLRTFTDPNGSILALDDLRTHLSLAGGFKVVESALEELGAVLGAESTRPELSFGRGPDNLWIFDAEAFVIEVKNEKVSNLSKNDAAQLQASVLWVEQNYKGLTKINPIIVSEMVTADVVADFAFGALVWKQTALNSLLDGLRKLASAAVLQGDLFLASPLNIQGMLSAHELLPGQVRSLGVSVQGK